MKKQETIIVDAIQDIEVNINSEIVLTDISVNQEEKFLNKKREKNIELQSEDKISASSKSDVVKKIEKRKRKKEKVKEKKKNQWYAPKVNSNIYVNCLPKDINEKEIIEYFSRCGFIRKDQRNDQYKVKLYKDSNGKNKGDALISFLREESVTMAVELLNETEIRPGFKIKVEKANFEQRGDYKPRETYKLDNIHRFKNKTDMNRMLGWNEEDNEKGLRIVVLKNMFEPKEFFEDEGLRKDLELDIIEECESNFGQVDKFLIYDENPDGIVKIKFNTPAAAEKCIKELHQRYYNEKLIEAFYWDGKTDFAKFQEDISSQEKRIDEFGRWLESTKDSEK